MRWNVDSKLFGTASTDTTIRVVDFGTEKVMYSGSTADGSNFIEFVSDFLIIGFRRSLVHLFYGPLKVYDSNRSSIPANPSKS